MAISDVERVAEGSWDGSAGRFSDEQYERSCVLDRKVCGGEWADKPPKTRCSLPIREPGGEINRAGVHAAAARISQVKDACPEALASAKAKLRSAYKSLGEEAPDSLSSSSKSEPEPKVYRDRALASMDHEWELREENDDGYLGTLAGHFAVFDRWTEIDSPLEGHFMERVAPGSFTKTFAENRKNMRVLLNHGKDPSVGLKPLGPIRTLEEDSTGAYYEVSLMDTTYNRDLIPGLKEGQFGASFRFQIRREDFVQYPERTDYNPEGIPESTIREAKVKEFGPVTFGQYDGATAGLRSLNDDLVGLELNLMARSDPEAIAEFARIISSGFGSSRTLVPFSANIGTSGTNATATLTLSNSTSPPKPAERNDPTPVDYDMLSKLKNVKASLTDVSDTQAKDPDTDDEDDDAVMAALEDAHAAIDKAIEAQMADCEPEDEDQEQEEEPEDSNMANPKYPGFSSQASEAEAVSEKIRTPVANPVPLLIPSTLATRAPVRGPTPPGATLKKRAALLTHKVDKEPVWKL